MDQATLVELDVHTGDEVLRTLDAAGLSINVAFWMFTAYYDDWRLVLSAPTFRDPHMLKAYEEVVFALQGHFVRLLPAMLILPSADPMIAELLELFGNADSVQGMRLGGQKFGGRYISDAYVYRIQQR